MSVVRNLAAAVVLGACAWAVIIIVGVWGVVR